MCSGPHSKPHGQAAPTAARPKSHCSATASSPFREAVDTRSKTSYPFVAPATRASATTKSPAGFGGSGSMSEPFCCTTSRSERSSRCASRLNRLRRREHLIEGALRASASAALRARVTPPREQRPAAAGVRGARTGPARVLPAATRIPELRRPRGAHHRHRHHGQANDRAGARPVAGRGPEPGTGRQQRRTSPRTRSHARATKPTAGDAPNAGQTSSTSVTFYSPPRRQGPR